MPAIASIGAVILGLIALLILYGTRALVKALQNIFGKLPAVGGFLSGVIGAVFLVIEDAIKWVMADWIQPVLSFIYTPIKRMIDLFVTIEQFAVDTYSQFEYLVGTAIPAAIKSLRTYAHTEASAVKNWAISYVHEVEHDLSVTIHAVHTYAYNLVHTLHAELDKAISAARVYAYDLVHTLHQELDKAISAEHAYAYSLTHTLHVELDKELSAIDAKLSTIGNLSVSAVTKLVDQGVTTAVKAAGSATAAAITTLDTTAVVGIDAVWGDVRGDVDALAGVIGNDLPDIGALVQAIPITKPLTIAASIADAVALSRVAVKYMEECGIPNCKNLSGVGRALQDLFKLVEGGTFLALFAEIAADPQAAAEDAAGFLGPIASGLESAARDLIGV